MKKYPFSRTGIIAIVGVLFVGAVILTGLHARQKFSNLQTTTNREWVILTGQFKLRDVLTSRVIEKVSTNPKFDKSLLARVQDAQEKLVEIRLHPSKPLTDKSILYKYDEAQKSLNLAMGKVLRTAFINGADPKTKRELMPLVLDLIRADNEIAVHSNRFDAFAQIYNVALRKFPLTPYAGILGFAPQPLLSVGINPGAVASSTGAR